MALGNLEDDPNEPAYIFYFILTGISVVLTATACWCIVTWGDLRFNVTKLMLSIHLTLLCEEILDIPFIYSWNPTLCGGVGLLRTYFGLSNAIATAFMMGFFYCGHMCDERIPLQVSAFIRTWSPIGIALFPLITVLPFITNSYGQSDDIWCRIKSEDKIDHIWSFAIYHFWSLLVMSIATYMVFDSVVAACKIHTEVGGRLFSSLGLYAVIALICFAFRMAVNLAFLFPGRQVDGNILRFISEVLVQVMGIGFAITLFYDISMVLDMRTGSEMFSRSSLATSSIMNWEGMLGSLEDIRATEIVETPLHL